MPLEDKDIFNAVFEKYRDQPIEFVMAQYEKAKLLNREIELRLNALAAPQGAAAQNVAAGAQALRLGEFGNEEKDGARHRQPCHKAATTDSTKNHRQFQTECRTERQNQEVKSEYGQQNTPPESCRSPCR